MAQSGLVVNWEFPIFPPLRSETHASVECRSLPWVSHVVLVETAWVLSSVYELNAGQVATAIEMFVNHRDLSVQDTDAVLAALEQFRKKPSLGFSDCLVLEIARRAGHMPLGTFDRDLGKLEGARRI
jgi:predicted nucleic-acid-binding protein